MSSYISSKIRLIRTILTVLLPFLYLLWGTRNGICRFLFTYSSSESPERIGSYYTSLERYFQGENNAVGIVRNGSELMEKFRKSVLWIWTLGGGMKSEPLTKPFGSLCDDEQLFWKSLKILEQGEWRFLLESNTEVQRKLGHHKAGSCFPHISSSVLWILVKLGTYGKLFLRGI